MQNVLTHDSDNKMKSHGHYWMQRLHMWILCVCACVLCICYVSSKWANYIWCLTHKNRIQRIQFMRHSMGRIHCDHLGFEYEIWHIFHDVNSLHGNMHGKYGLRNGISCETPIWMIMNVNKSVEHGNEYDLMHLGILI